MAVGNLHPDGKKAPARDAETERKDLVEHKQMMPVASNEQVASPISRAVTWAEVVAGKAPHQGTANKSVLRSLS